MDYYPNLLKLYREQLVPELKKRLNLNNVMQVPRLEKIVVNMGVGEAIDNSKSLESAVEELRIITGQQPAISKSKKAISNFKLRSGIPIGCYVTLRGWRMYEFLERLINVAVPRIRDFRGLSDSSFDGRGNYSMGVKEQIIFPEINYDKVEKIHGMDITIVTTAEDDQRAEALLSGFGMPFKKKS
ncbi:MAG: 50S ribosomal protein L5 [candidate division KSB1 bacterium]|jgi:large subunit ribosomal protein L5|nr:50S ribosomal protein L5 [candidate division KSB1 bacterium]